MTQERANKIFDSELGQQLNEIFVTSDDAVFIRQSETEAHCKENLKEGDNPTKYNITVWYPEY